MWTHEFTTALRVIDNDHVRSPWWTLVAGTLTSIGSLNSINPSAQILELHELFKQIASPSFTAIVLETHLKIAVICPSINRGSRRKGVGIIAGFPFPQPTPPYDIKPILNSQHWGGEGCGALLLINKAGITQPAGYWGGCEGVRPRFRCGLLLADCVTSHPDT